MEDLIACLYPADDREQGGQARNATKLPENGLRFFETSTKKQLPEEPGRYSRESTVPLDESEATTVKHNPAPTGEGLRLTFTDGPKSGPGFFLGTDPNSCDIVLPPLPSISRRHCYLTFDTERRLIVRDCSMNGTIVKYDGEGGQKRRDFTWIIGGENVFHEKQTIVIQLDEILKFRIIVPKPSFLDVYYKNVDEFLNQSVVNAGLPFGTLGIQSNSSTAGPSGVQTVSQDPILLPQKTLGKGAFSIVNRVWDVSTGILYASKTFHNPLAFDWRKEASLMRRISHEHVVQLHFAMETPEPQLILEYLPLGSLDQQHCQRTISVDEAVATLQQCLRALTYLHEQTPPIVHRDIKPENILVQSREPFQIKLGDFGLSKASEDLATLCGTPRYLAPEIASYYKSKFGPNTKYTHAIDIWSLGVVIFQYIYGLPDPGSSEGLSWCEKIVKRLDDWESDDLLNLLSSMVVIEPQIRNSARQCLKRALELDLPRRSILKPGRLHESSPLPLPQTGSATPTGGLSTREMYELRDRVQKSSQATMRAAHRNDSSIKRQRSVDRNSRRTKSVLHESTASVLEEAITAAVYSTHGNAIHTSVLDLLHDIQSKNGIYETVDSHTLTLVNVVCQHLQRLEIGGLKTHSDCVTERTIITAIDPFREFTVASFTSSDRAHSVRDLAQSLAHILELLSPDSSIVLAEVADIPASQ